ncbi:hypothetical protein P4S95_04470 [Aneurinibacillus aneurinilyticus]|uniref:Uncharacterized protein n=1 Tax=Aneurinibacillus aneurinilyticus ATCC 12856 TaxID=649747 RepID=U1YIA1_ANEAE|nr:hypothetical protein [Aneurinibacillus aneurinilyticus]ERI10521.1 hypothetical protein HMPREF0083_01427 [Aneurinibacillus aneurinilyticus ATCC 12856]MED0669479.1 hypothetical protein [Aneurinibacillus aneurinilyticus]
MQGEKKQGGKAAPSVAVGPPEQSGGSFHDTESYLNISEVGVYCLLS